MTGPLILCLGNDLTLLSTRKMVLETQFSAIHCSTLEEAVTQWPECPFDVLILCHTLSDKECTAAEQYAETRTPASQLLVLHAGGAIHSSRACVLRNLDGPEPLLKTIHQLLQKFPSSAD